MNLANKFTLLRIILAPVFFIVYFLPVYFPSWFETGFNWTVPVLLFVFIFSQLTDLFDGMAARRRNETSDFGKFFDPFADTIMQVTCFICFVIDGVLPAILFLLVVYREFFILFLRNLMLKKGILIGARISGKVKTVFYITTASFSLIMICFERLEVFESSIPYLKTGILTLFSISVIIAIISFFDYFSVYKKDGKNL